MKKMFVPDDLVPVLKLMTDGLDVDRDAMAVKAFSHVFEIEPWAIMNQLRIMSGHLSLSDPGRR
jgi:hypothetical protein